MDRPLYRPGITYSSIMLSATVLVTGHLKFFVILIALFSLSQDICHTVTKVWKGE